ncbi:hypothetical protein [Arthrobacter sp. HY1533]|uniref:hypothetical protein n=1 Tax=Arthrobacter sp. HY1533 TaxID=2970919 RepID=UPI0022B9E5A9|nr:hypothetical protein [Arthrobacter sp. HY1533]
MNEQTASSHGSLRKRLVCWYLVGASAFSAGIVTGLARDWTTGGVVTVVLVTVWLGYPAALTSLGKQWSAGLPLSRSSRTSTSEFQSDHEVFNANPTDLQAHTSLTNLSRSAPASDEYIKQVSTSKANGSLTMNDSERRADLIRLGDLLPVAISSPQTIRQIAIQAGIIPGKLVDENISAETLWPDVIGISERFGKTDNLILRIHKKLEHRVDVDEIREIISRLNRQ